VVQGKRELWIYSHTHTHTCVYLCMWECVYKWRRI